MNQRELEHEQLLMRRMEVKRLMNKGYSPRKIVRRTGEHTSFVYRWVTRFKMGESFQDRSNRRGSSRFNTPEFKQVIAQVVEDTEGKASLKQVTATVNQILQTHDSFRTFTTSTIRKEMGALGYQAYVRPRKSLMPESAQKRRLKRAQDQVGKDEYKSTLFSDECHIELNGIQRRRFQWRKSRDQVVPIEKGRSKLVVKIWAAISYTGRTALHFYDTMNSKTYCEILTTSVASKAQMRRLFPNGGKWIFQQDGASSHSAKATTAWLEKKKINFMSCGRAKNAVWPSYSPDLNPIEHLWSILKDIVNRQHLETKIKTLDELKTCVTRAWNSISQSVIQRCFDSLPSRYQKVIDANGGHIHLWQHKCA